MSGPFDQSSIADDKALNLQLKELTVDLIYDNYYSKFKNKSVFKAVILSGYVTGNATVDDPGDADPATFPKKYKLRPIEIHDLFLPDPLEVKENSENSFLQFKRLVKLHPFGFPEMDIENNAKAQYVYGDIVTFRFEEGPSSRGFLRSIRIIQKVDHITGLLPFQKTLGSITHEPSARDVLNNGGAITAAEARREKEAAPSETSSTGHRVSWSSEPGVVLTTAAQRNFLDNLTKRLSKTSWSKTLIVNSGTRGPERQIRAIIKQYDKRASWFDDKYKKWKPWRSEIKKILQNKSIDRIKTGADVIRKAISAGRYMSLHNIGLAVDIQTINFTYNEVVALLKVIRDMQQPTYVRWENIEGWRNTQSMEKRRSGTVKFIDYEHVHIGLSNIVDKEDE